MKRFAEGDLTVRLNIESRDEFGSIARSLNTAIEASAKSFNELATCNREMNTLLNKVEQAREEKEKLYEELLTVARQAGMAEVATDVLHNVGNVLNSVNVSAQVVAEKLHANRAEGLVRACSLIDQHRSSIGSFFSTDARGQKLPEFLSKLADVLVRENNEVVAEMAQLVENIEHIKHIVSMQQSLAKSCSLQEPVDLIKLLENAERMNDSSLTRHAVTVYRDFNVIPTVVTDKHKVLQVLVNLIKNAKQAVSTEPQEERWIRLSIDQPNPSTVNIKVSDNGVGITTENLGKLFTHGFTTRKTGHGFGLHSGALAAKELGGRLSVHSDGPGLGATFTLELPVASEIVSLDSALTNAPMLNSMSTSECISNFV